MSFLLTWKKPLAAGQYEHDLRDILKCRPQQTRVRARNQQQLGRRRHSPSVLLSHRARRRRHHRLEHKC